MFYQSIMYMISSVLLFRSYIWEQHAAYANIPQIQSSIVS